MVLGADMGCWAGWGEPQQVGMVGSEVHKRHWGTGCASVNKRLCRLVKRSLSF